MKPSLMKSLISEGNRYNNWLSQVGIVTIAMAAYTALFSHTKDMTARQSHIYLYLNKKGRS